MAAEIDLWIDVTVPDGDGWDLVCTLFARHEFSVRPLAGESISYHPLGEPDRGERRFVLITGTVPVPERSVSVVVDEVRHGAVATGDGVTYRTTATFEPIRAGTVDDARKVCELMIHQFGFEIDPYSVNLLGKPT